MTRNKNIAKKYDSDIKLDPKNVHNRSNQGGRRGA